MAFVPIESYPGLVSFTNVDASAARTIPVGTIVRGFDATNGAGEFIYLPGVASLAVGSLVTWNPVDKTTTIVPNTAKLGYPVAASLTANTAATSYSWFQIGGAASVLKSAAAIAKGARIAISGTAGSVLGASTAGKFVMGAVAVNSTVSATTFAKVLLNRCFMEALAT
jgi:hypothetical protein